jgi:hypothetical protein
VGCVIGVAIALATAVRLLDSVTGETPDENQS